MLELIPLLVLTFMLGKTWSQLRRSSVSRLLWLSMLFCAIWSLIRMIRISFDAEPWMIPLATLLYFFVSLTCGVMTHFARSLMQPSGRLILMLFYLPPVLVLLATLSDPWLHLMVAETRILGQQLMITPGPGFRVHSLLCVLQGVWTVTLVARYIHHKRLSLLPFLLMVALLLADVVLVDVFPVISPGLNLTTGATAGTLCYFYYLVYIRRNPRRPSLAVYRSAANVSGNDRFLVFSKNGDLLDHSSAMAEFLKLSVSQLSRLKYAAVDGCLEYLPDDPALARIQGNGQHGSGGDGLSHLIRYKSRIFRVEKPTIAEACHLIYFRDITDKYQAWQAKYQLEFVDQLTGLKNSHAVAKDLQTPTGTLALLELGCLQWAEQTPTQVGSELELQRRRDAWIRECAATLKQYAERSENQLYRLSDERICIYLPQLSEESQITIWFRDLYQHLSQPLQAEYSECTLRPSIGIVQIRRGDSLDKLLHRASLALQHVKSLPDTDFMLADARFSVPSERAERIDDEIIQAIDARQLVPFYQARISPQSGEVTGAAISLRWCHPELGTIFPAEFIASLRRKEQLHRLDFLSVELLLRDAQHWLETGVIEQGFRLAVHCSWHSLIQPALPAFIDDTARACGVPLAMIDLELSTNVINADSRQTEGALRRLKGLNLVLRLENNHLSRQLRSRIESQSLQGLKLSSRLVSSLTNTGRAPFMLQEMMKGLQLRGCRIIADGVKDQQQLAALQRLGIAEAQGSFLPSPAPGEAFARQLLKHKQQRALCQA